MVQKIYTGVTGSNKNKQVTYRFFPDKRYLFMPLLALNLFLFICLSAVLIYHPTLNLPAVASCFLALLFSLLYLYSGRKYVIRFSPHLVMFPTATIEISGLKQISFRRIKLSAVQRYFMMIAGFKPEACYLTLHSEHSTVILPVKLDKGTAENFAWLISRMAWTNESKLIPLVSELEKVAQSQK